MNRSDSSFRWRLFRELLRKSMGKSHSVSVLHFPSGRGKLRSDPAAGVAVIDRQRQVSGRIPDDFRCFRLASVFWKPVRTPVPSRGGTAFRNNYMSLQVLWRLRGHQVRPHHLRCRWTIWDNDFLPTYQHPRRQSDDWIIVHEHFSVPLAPAPPKNSLAPPATTPAHQVRLLW